MRVTVVSKVTTVLMSVVAIHPMMSLGIVMELAMIHLPAVKILQGVYIMHVMEIAPVEHQHFTRIALNHQYNHLYLFPIK
jgi:hypothetical protein